MIHVTSIEHVSDSGEAGRQIAQLRHVQALIEELAGQPSSSTGMLDDMARISRAYAEAPSIVRRRFDAFAAETADWAAVGVKALTAAGDPARCSRAAARCLADELARSLRKLGRIVLQ